MEPIPVLYENKLRFRNRGLRYHGKNLPCSQSIRDIFGYFKKHGTAAELRKSTSVNKKRPVNEDDVSPCQKSIFEDTKTFKWGTFLGDRVPT